MFSLKDQWAESSRTSCLEKVCQVEVTVGRQTTRPSLYSVCVRQNAAPGQSLLSMIALLYMQRPQSDGAIEEDVAYFNPLKATLRVNSERELGELLSRTTLSNTGVLGRLCGPRGGRCVDPAKAAALVSGLLGVAADRSTTLRGKVRLVTEGQAVRLEVYPDVGGLLWGRLACTVVFVPCLELNGHSYASRPDSGQSSRRWSRTFAVEEQTKLRLADKQDGGCRMMVLRTLNILCRRVPSLTGFCRIGA